MKVDWENFKVDITNNYHRNGESERNPASWKSSPTCRRTYEVLLDFDIQEPEWEHLYFTLGKQRLAQKASELDNDHAKFIEYINDCLILFDSIEAKVGFLNACLIQHASYSGSVNAERRIYNRKNEIEITRLKNEIEQLAKAIPPQTEIKNESYKKKKIDEIFNSIDRKGWQYAFASEKEYNLFADLLTNFFEDKPNSLPKTAIKLNRRCKTKVGIVLGELHKKMSNKDKLITDTDYFKLIRVLSPFEKETDGDVYKALTR